MKNIPEPFERFEKEIKDNKLILGSEFGEIMLFNVYSISYVVKRCV